VLLLPINLLQKWATRRQDQVELAEEELVPLTEVV
jgi:hypothetical protein